MSPMVFKMLRVYPNEVVYEGVSGSPSHYAVIMQRFLLILLRNKTEVERTGKRLGDFRTKRV